MSAFYQTSPVKRHRRSSDQLDNLLLTIKVIIASYHGEPITIRHLFYRLIAAGAFPKDEREYSKLCSHLAKWRRSGDIPFDVFVDGTRWHIAGATFDDAATALRDSVTSYRKNLWQDQDHYVEVWVEKDAIMSLVSPVANAWGNPNISVQRFRFDQLDVQLRPDLQARDTER